MAPSFSFLVAFVILFTSTALAAPPKLTQLLPTGAQRGQSAVITATGDFSAWPVSMWCENPGVQIVAENDKGKFRVTVTADATPGFCWLRAYNTEGASAPRPFFIDQLPEAEEAEPNDSPDQAQVISLPAIVSGRLAKRGDVDGSVIELKKGQTLVASLQGQRGFGSPMDAVLQVCQRVERKASTLTGDAPQIEAFVVAQNHDARGQDPLVVFTAPRDGAYIVRAFAFPAEADAGVNFSGAETFLYRLTLTTGPFVDHTLPLAAPRGATEVKLFGWNLPDNATSLLQELKDTDESYSTAFLAGASGAWNLPRVEHPCLLADDNAATDAGQNVMLPCTLSGRLSTAGAAHNFRFSAKKNDKLRIELDARDLGFPLDGVLMVTGADGKELQRVDDVNKRPDPSLVFTPPADGEYRVGVRDLHDRGGLRMVYRLTLAPIQPDFLLALAADSFVIAPGKTLEIPLTIDRRDNFAANIQIAPLDLPAGITADAAVSTNKGDSAKAVKLVLRAADDAQPFQGPLRILGKTEDGALVRSALVKNDLPGTGPIQSVWLTLTAKP